jgi:hypothetical protein
MFLWFRAREPRPTVNGFKPGAYGAREHAATTYPPEVGDASVPTENSHLPLNG